MCVLVDRSVWIILQRPPQRPLKYVAKEYILYSDPQVCDYLGWTYHHGEVLTANTLEGLKARLPDDMEDLTGLWEDQPNVIEAGLHRHDRALSLSEILTLCSPSR